MTKIVSHRGANKFAPENTFAAADLALMHGADYIELDVRESADGVLYVMHDETLDRTTNGSGAIGHFCAQDIDQLDAGAWFNPDSAGQPVPRLDAYLDHFRGRCGVYIELKYCNPIKVARLVLDLGMADDTFYFSFSSEMRDGIHAAAPQFRKMITLDMAKSPSLAKPLHHASILEITPAQMVVPGLMDTCRTIGLEVMVYYGGDDLAVHKAIAEAGPDYVNVDRPDLFQPFK